MSRSKSTRETVSSNSSKSARSIRACVNPTTSNFSRYSRMSAAPYGAAATPITIFNFSISPGPSEQRWPPRLSVDVPIDCFFEPFLEIFSRLPFQFLPREGGIDGVTPVVPKPIGHERNEALRFVHL